MGMAEAQKKGKKPTIAEQKLAKKEPKRPLTNAESAARNKRLAQVYQEERLRSFFGPARDWMPKKQRRELIPEEVRQQSEAIAPTRRRISRVEENVAKLAKKPHPLATNVMEKALKNLCK